MKIIDKINANVKEGKTFFSFEFFPPRACVLCAACCVMTALAFVLAGHA